MLEMYMQRVERVWGRLLFEGYAEETRLYSTRRSPLLRPVFAQGLPMSLLVLVTSHLPLIRYKPVCAENADFLKSTIPFSIRRETKD